jgi:hypothetical protein
MSDNKIIGEDRYANSNLKIREYLLGEETYQIISSLMPII